MIIRPPPQNVWSPGLMVVSRLAWVFIVGFGVVNVGPKTFENIGYTDFGMRPMIAASNCVCVATHSVVSSAVSHRNKLRFMILPWRSCHTTAAVYVNIALPLTISNSVLFVRKVLVRRLFMGYERLPPPHGESDAVASPRGEGGGPDPPPPPPLIFRPLSRLAQIRWKYIIYKVGRMYVQGDF